MFSTEERTTNFRSALGLLELIYVATVRSTRKSHRNALVGLISNMFQTMILVAVFFVFIEVLGMRSMAVRGDFILYLLSGIFLFMTHIKAVGAVAGAEGPTSAMMLHAPMNTAIAIASGALASLYIQTLSAAAVLFIVHVAWRPVEIHDPVGTVAMFLLAWGSGAAVGMVFLAIRPFLPGLSGLASTIYRRANMVASGKMFLANTLSTSMLAMFDWNPLFHIIDQARGFAFINYNPMHTSIGYPVKVAIVLLMIGLMGEFYGRKHASLSWSAGK
ncbi:MAG: ABC transporter permease [Litoreibacter sp.]|nr:ABC transporter permease [Litoreibacter sp.]